MCIRDSLQCAALVRSVALYGFDQIRNEIVALLELDVDVGEGLIDALPKRDKPVVDKNDVQCRGEENGEDDKRRGHAGAPRSKHFRQNSAEPFRNAKANFQPHWCSGASRFM